jgi:outer membrane lipase/esterase
MKPVHLFASMLLGLGGCGEEPALRNAPAAAEPAKRAEFQRVVVFGDSLVDAGNVHLATGGRYAAEAKGFVAGRFTNGFTFADRIAMGVEGRVTVPTRKGGNNYAHGGAKAMPDDDGIPDAQFQVEGWLAGREGEPEPTTLFILTFGGNDLRHPRRGSGSAEAYHQAVAQSYAGAVRTLFTYGARNVLITGAPLLNGAGESLQRQLDKELGGIELREGQRLLRYDFLPFWRSLLADAPRLGFRPWTAKAAATASMAGAERISGDDCVGDRRQAGGCAGYVLFDRVHPTAAVHALIARDMAAKLGIPIADPPAR